MSTNFSECKLHLKYIELHIFIDTVLQKKMIWVKAKIQIDKMMIHVINYLL